MKKVKGSAYYENGYAGATVGAFLLSESTVLVDAPLKPEDGRAWLADLREAGASHRNLVVSLDSHPDRTLGVQTLETQVVAQREVVRQIRRRAAIFKALKQESGAEWEETPGLSGLRWILPRLTFSEQMRLELGEDELVLEHHPGSSPGACWLISPKDQVMFVGDTLTLGEPPFFAQADIPMWLEQLDVLSSKQYKNYAIMAGRGGRANSKDISAMKRLLKDVESQVKKLSRRKKVADGIEKVAAKLAHKFKAPAKRQVLYEQRLRHGLTNYLSRHNAAGGGSSKK